MDSTQGLHILAFYARLETRATLRLECVKETRAHLVSIYLETRVLESLTEQLHSCEIEFA